jgi:uncharacterized membrane protein YqjE
VKKFVLTGLALIVILAAIIGVWQWQKHLSNPPIRQERIN